MERQPGIYMDGKTILLLLLSMVPGLFLYAEPLNWKETFNGVADSSLPETEEPADTLLHPVMMSVSALSEEEPDLPVSQYLPASPQVASLMRYGDYPVSLGTGLPNISIPLYNVQLGDYVLPISISYHASGIRLDDVASSAGLGWTLNAGGCIGRTIHGRPDLQGTHPAINDTLYRNYSRVKALADSIYLHDGDWSDLRPMIVNPHNSPYDPRSDRYTFNFGTYTGHFFYSHQDRKFIPLNHTPMYIDATSGLESSFRIVTPDGIEYLFNDREYTGYPDDENVIDVSAWYLSEIHTPHGNIHFHYHEAAPFELYTYSQTLDLGYFNRWEDLGGDTEDTPEGEGGIKTLKSRSHYQYRMLLVDTIEWKGNRVVFAYSNGRRDVGTERMTGMQVIDANGMVRKSVSFDTDCYMGNDSTDYRMLLASLSDSESGTYAFDYDESLRFPPYNTQGLRINCMTDYWGYWNGSDTRRHVPAALIRQAAARLDESFYPNQLDDGANRTPVEEYTKTGILKSIIYPTGGRTSFTFEQNEVGHCVGGLRIREIANYDSNDSLAGRKVYTYLQREATQDPPENFIIYTSYHRATFRSGHFHIYRHARCSGDPLQSLTDGSGSPALYKYVLETELNGDYVVSTFIKGPEIDYLGFFPDERHPSLREGGVNFQGTYTPFMTGKYWCDSLGHCVRGEDYEYSYREISQFPVGTVIIGVIDEPYLLSRDYNPNYLLLGGLTAHCALRYLSSKTVTDVAAGVSTTETYTYDPDFRTLKPKTVTTTASDGSAYRTEYDYVLDQSGDFYSQMVNEYLTTDPLIETRRYCNNRLLSTTRTDYMQQNGWYYPEFIRESTGSNTPEEKYHFAEYDGNGNPLTFVTNKTDTTALVWGYGHRYPIARVDGISHSRLFSDPQLGSMLSVAGITSDTGQLNAYINILRNRLGSSALVTDYRWQPLTGVTAITSPNRSTALYTYDSAGRLASAGFSDGVRQSHEYQYKHPAGSAQTCSDNHVHTLTYLNPQGSHSVSSTQYYDDLGRPNLTAANGMNTAGNYVYSFLDYDLKGRVDRQWLPAIGGVTCECLDSAAFLQLSASTYDNDSYAFAQNTYDGAGRVVATSSPGAAWHSASKSVTTEYVGNVAGEVKLYRAPLDSITLQQDGYYAAKMLVGQMTTDEDGHRLTVFTDRQGRKVLERRNAVSGTASENHDTYFVYNDLGQLRYVLSPEYQQAGYKAKYAYEYRYDARGRMVKKILPGCEYEQYWYDRADRLVYEQDATLRSRGLYRFMLYDKLGRLCLQGTCSDCNRGQTVNAVAYATVGTGFCGSGYELANADVLVNPQLEVVNYYDGYDFTRLYADTMPMLGDATHTACTTGLLTGTVQATSNGQRNATAFYYDGRGRVVDTREHTIGGRFTATHTDYTFTDAVARTERNYYTVSGNQPSLVLSTATQNTYDEGSGLLTATTLTVTPAGGVERTQQIQQLSYNGLGRVSQMQRGGSAGNVSYGYNLRGWTTSISGTGYSQQLRYNDGLGTPCYNGNVSSMTWLSAGDQYLRQYRFTYDGQDRLTEAVYGERDFDKNMNRYDEKVLQYSMNGSVRRLQRRGQKNDGQYGKVDNLTLHYDGNQLVAVEDDAAPVTTYDSFDFRDGASQEVEYTYNGVGALTGDQNKGITAIAYDNLNNPCRIQFSGGNATEYVYSADGRKLLTRHITGTAAILNPRLASSPRYIGHDSLLTEQPGLLRTIADSTEYVGDAILLNGQLERLLFPGGYVTLDSLLSPVFHYFTQDHLGNVRAVVSEDGTVEQVTHYYPFGGVFGDAGSNADLQPYKYNGKELDRLHGLDWYDYGARMYDAQVANWFRVDPLCEKYYNVSPYMYCAGNPVNYLDLGGDSILNSYDSQLEIARNSYEGLIQKQKESNEPEMYEKAIKTAKNNYAQITIRHDKINTLINEFKNTSPNLFKALNNMKYNTYHVTIGDDGIPILEVRKHNLDVSISLGTVAVSNGPAHTVIPVFDGQFIKNNLINTVISEHYENLPKDILPHELGHAYLIGQLKNAYKSCIQMHPKHNCQVKDANYVPVIGDIPNLFSKIFYTRW